MCESYILINDGKIKSTTSATKLVEQAYDMGFFDNELKKYLVLSVKLRNRYTHDYYLREDSEKAIEEFCSTYNICVCMIKISALFDFECVLVYVIV